MSRNLSSSCKAVLEQDEEKFAQVNRALKIRGCSNRTLLHSINETTLLNEICEIAVDMGGYRMAWVGYAVHDEEKTVRPVAQAGFEVGYLEAAKVTWEDDARGHGPVGTAIRTGQTKTVRDIMKDPNFAPWRDEAIRCGYKSTIALPLKSEGKTFGELAIYASETNAFDEAEVEILEELAGDLAFGLTMLQLRERRDTAEKSLVEAKEAAEKALRIKSRFLDIAAHELRTPVTVFSSLIQLGQKRIENGLPITSEFMGRIRSSGDRLARLVSDLLGVSRLERGLLVLHRERTNLMALVSECVEEFQLQLPTRLFLLSKPDILPEVELDRLRIYQVLSNLLDNAIKYTPLDSTIEIEISASSTNVRVSVRDHGAGIPESQQEILFTPFCRGTSDETIRASGLGLGLSVSRGLIELHDGTIGVESKEGEGSTFYFELPFKSFAN